MYCIPNPASSVALIMVLCNQCVQSIVPSISLAGPTSFAPLIYQAISIVKQAPGRLVVKFFYCPDIYVC